jgi:predicted  nucleic acid-binding Zn-ribbon protein
MKEVMELNKTIKDLKMELETIKKAQRETTVEIEILGKKSETIDSSISNRIQEIEERISGAEDCIETGSNIHFSLISLNTNELNFPIKRH